MHVRTVSVEGEPIYLMGERATENRQHVPGAPMGIYQPGSHVSVSRAIAAPFTILSLGAAAIHFAVTPSHFHEWWAFGLFFAAIGWFQALWPIAYVLRPTTGSAGVAVVVNLATVGVWLWSRLAGLPFGPDAGTPEPLAAADVLATLLELALVVGLGATRLVPGRARLLPSRVPPSRLLWWTTGLALVVGIATTLANRLRDS